MDDNLAGVLRSPTIRATIRRRILVNYRVAPEALAALLPPPFRPSLVGDHGIAGICLMRLGHIRPAALPAAVGVTTEFAAHRVAVEWDTADGPVTGVYIPRRDTSSRVSALLGGRLFPGWLHRAHFQVDEGGGAYRVSVSSRDGLTQMTVAAHLAGDVMPGSVFVTVEQASGFFRCAPLGYAATPAVGVFDGVTLATEGWDIQPLHLDDVRSSYFDDGARFGPGEAVPDSAFLMAGLDTTWMPQPRLLAGAGR